MRILIVEDDHRIAKPLAKDLRHQSHVVDVAVDGLEGWEFAQSMDYDVILLDWMLPHLSGVELCSKLRTAHCQAMILMLTAKDTTQDKIVGLDAGADDYLVKPFKLDELAARLRALSRRSRELKPTVIAHGKWKLDPSAHLISYQDKALKLTPKEYVILEYFLRHPGQVIPRETLLDYLWDYDQAIGEGTIKTHIGNIRGKLKANGYPPDSLETVYGVGYRLAL